MKIIPTRPEPAYRFRIILDGKAYRMTKRWNSRARHWTLDIADDSQTLLISGLKLVIDYPLLRHHVDARLPPGELICLDVRGNRLDRPGFDSFAEGNCTLVYKEF